jgi:hypothetical protein
LRAARAAQPSDYREKAGTVTHDQSADGWTAVLRRQPTRIVDGRPEGGYTDAFEIVCCDCGDDPGLDYRQVAPELQQIRGPGPIVGGVAAYETHLIGHHQTGAYRQG